jgi:Flp pilus assembly protein TadD
VNLAAGHPEAAVKCLHTALHSRLDYFDAHYNLGTALVVQNNFAPAVEKFRAAARLDPQDANAHANLRAAPAELRNFERSAHVFGKSADHQSYPRKRA